jgi:hypothetical protein
MNSYSTKFAYQFVSEPLLGQRIGGTVRLRFWAQSLNLTRPATWAVAIRLVSRDGKENRGELLPLTTGRESDGFGPEMEARIVGPLPLVALNACSGDRIMLQLGSHGDARIEVRDDGQSSVTFSTDILFEDLQTALADTRVSRRIGQCIYCGRADGQLSREHIIPEGLNGEWTLTNASCDRCAQITSRFETDLLQNAFGPARLALRMRTKRPAERPQHLPLLVRRGGAEVSIPIPVEEYPAVIALPVFAPPAYMNQDSGSSLLRVVNARPIQVAGRPLAELHAKYGYEYTAIQLEYKPVAFARAVAKIAYAFAVLRLGLERITDRYVLPVVLGKTGGIGQWVGCDAGEPVGPSTGLHALTLQLTQNEIHMFVRLFAQFDAPEYHVIVGRTR